MTYTLFEKSLDNDRIHGLVLVHLSDLGSDYISRKALHWVGIVGKSRHGVVNEQLVTCFAQHLLFIRKGGQRCGREKFLASAY